MQNGSPIPIVVPQFRDSLQAKVVWGGKVVTVGGGAPVRIQSMTNTDTVDAIGTAIQVKELALAGSEMVRITVNTPEAAQAVPYIRGQLDRMGIDVPLVGDFHYNGHRLLSEFPDCAQAVDVGIFQDVMSGRLEIVGLGGGQKLLPAIKIVAVEAKIFSAP